MEKEYFEFLDDLRDSGVTNVFGSAPILAEEFGLCIRHARTIVGDYMRQKQNSYNGNIFL